MTLIFIGMYVAIGLVLAVLVARRGSKFVHVVMVVPLWPMLAPSMLGTSSATPELAELEGLSAPEREAVRRFQRHLAGRIQQLEALKRLRRQSKGRITERFDLVEAELVKDIDSGRALLEELVDRVALAQVATLGHGAAAAPDRLRVETLIARADALVQETSSPQ